jgi:hypothetical protein
MNVSAAVFVPSSAVHAAVPPLPMDASSATK